jgi:hypothetical protein
MTNTDADRRREKQAEKIIDLFRDAHGRGPRTIEELEAWASSADGKRHRKEFHDRDGKIIPD